MARTRYRLDPEPLFRSNDQSFDEVGRCGSRTKADDHPILDELDRFAARCLFCILENHNRPESKLFYWIFKEDSYIFAEVMEDFHGKYG